MLIADRDDADEFNLTEEMEAELEAAAAEIERGEWVDGDEVLAMLRSKRERSRIS
jgi:predicted transcriptional regulator